MDNVDLTLPPAEAEKSHASNSETSTLAEQTGTHNHNATGVNKEEKNVQSRI